MVSRVLVPCLVLLAGVTAGPAAGDPLLMPEGSFVIDGGDREGAREDGWRLDPRLGEGQEAATRADYSLTASVAALARPTTAQAPPPAPRPRAFTYSDAYRKRLKIHKYASYATLPLFVSQYFVGQKLYDGNASDSTRSLHGALAATTAVLFGVNTVTGVWNLYEGRKDPNHRTKRMAHGIMMLAADAGFVATGMMAPDDEGEGGNASSHRTVALVSMGIATAAYLIMIIGN